MRYNKKNNKRTKKTNPRKLTTRNRWKNNRSSIRKQYKTRKSYKQMKGGFISKTTMKEMLNPTNNKPEDYKNAPTNPKLIGALIIETYNGVKESMKIQLPDIPNTPKKLDVKQTTEIDKLKETYTTVEQHTNLLQIDKQYSEIFSDLKQPLSWEEFRMWLIYILEGNVYKKILPVYTQNEFHKFKLLALSLYKLLISIRPVNKHKSLPKNNPLSITSPEYTKYETFNIWGLNELLSDVVKVNTTTTQKLCEMCCVISLSRYSTGNIRLWGWEGLNEIEKQSISPNTYCAKRRAKRFVLTSGRYEPLDKFNVANLKYDMKTVEEYNKPSKGGIEKIVQYILKNVEAEKIKNLFKETLQFTHITIIDDEIKVYYKYYEFKIRHSSINDPEHPNLPLPVIICTLSVFDEDGICDTEFVYVYVPEPEPLIVDDRSKYEKEVKQQTFFKLKSEMMRIQSLLGGQTLKTPTTEEETLKQYYDTIDLRFDQTRLSDNSDTEDKPNKELHILEQGEVSTEPCTLILNYETNQETKTQEPVWKAANATSKQKAAFTAVANYLKDNTITRLDDKMIRVYKITNGKEGDAKITVLVEVKKIEDEILSQVEYQALGGERYEVYRDSTSARAAAERHKSHYNWVTDSGIIK